MEKPGDGLVMYDKVIIVVKSGVKVLYELGWTCCEIRMRQRKLIESKSVRR